jgi:DNA recombination protein RmuC
MEAVIIVLLVALLGIAAVAVVWLLSQRRPAADAEAQRQEQQAQRLEQQLATMKAELAQAVGASQQTVLQQVNSVDAKLNQRLDAVQSTVGQGLSAVQTDLNKTLTSQNETIGKIGEQLGGLDQAAKRMTEVEQTLGKDVSSLKEILQPPKLRGAFGEFLLEELMRQTLPAALYSTQYRFNDNTVVDFVIHTPDGLVPIDSKFPLESFKRLLDASSEEEQTRQRKAFMRDVRTRIEEVARYIRPDENTLDFAIMYVPAENIYYEALVGAEGESVMTFALERHVQLTSPNTFHAMLQTVTRVLARIQIQQSALEIQGRLDQLRREFTRFRAEFRMLGTHVSRAKNKYDDLDKIAGRFDDRLALAAQSELPDMEPIQAPLPDAIAAPAPLAEPALTNGSDEG